eukprot:TRINITY_DN33633_c0_g1_i2.p1 TRINITY_DN33633_c0_g1~~TRINITY_DN33633_c0_g1_i2.p1  ORF type:complete len:334 (+),score=86.21 TRINITY_DN33633_c0_g1_i2:73-1002(+)
MPAGVRTRTRPGPDFSGPAKPLLPPRYSHWIFPSVPSVRAGGDAPPQVSAVTWNLLAPCWKRLPGGGRESGSEELWRGRLRRQLELIRACHADIVLLQEWWHASADYTQLWRDYARETGAVLFASPRTGGKPDGLAVLVRQQLAGGATLRTYGFGDFGDRVAQLVTLPAAGLAVCNAHLTFAHENEWDPQMRYHQARKLAEVLRKDVVPWMPLLLAGDLNGELRDPAVAHLLQAAGLTPQAADTGWVSHVDHNGRRLGCDYIATRGAIAMQDHTWHGALDADDPESDHLLLCADMDRRAHDGGTVAARL